MRRTGIIGGLALLVVAGCGPTSVERTGGSYGIIPRPDRILVYDFAVTPEEVKLDKGISSRAQQFFEEHQGTSRTAQEIKIGHAVANAVADAVKPLGVAVTALPILAETLRPRDGA